MVSYKTYKPEYIESQVDLIWKITDRWKYNYQTSYDTVRKAYSREGFDPESRFYAFEDNELVGFAGVNFVENAEDEKVAQMRLPLVINDDREIINQLQTKIESYLKSKGVSKINVVAGVGMGNTMKIAEALGYKQDREVFKRTYANISDLKLSGNTEGVQTYKDEDEAEVRDLFKFKMGMSEQQGEGFFQWALGNSKRKQQNNPNSSSWQLYKDGNKVLGYSYLMKSDHQPHIAHSMPIYVESGSEAKLIMDQLLSAHKKAIPDIKIIGNYLIPNLYALEPLYNSIGFEFEPTYIYKKTL